MTFKTLMKVLLSILLLSASWISMGAAIDILNEPVFAPFLWFALIGLIVLYYTQRVLRLIWRIR